MAYFKFTDIEVAALISALPDQGDGSSRKALALQTTSDLGFEAATHLLEHKKIDLQEIGILLFVSKTPDYRSPATAIVLQGRLQLSKDCLAFDINMGGTGFSTALQAGCSLLDSLNKKYALLVVGDTISKQIAANDPMALEYGDGASAILLEKKSGAKPIYVENNANGEGFQSFMIPSGGFRYESGKDITEKNTDPSFDLNYIKADQAEMARYAATEIPPTLLDFIHKNKAQAKAYDFIAMPSPDQNFLQLIAEKLQIPPDHFPQHFEQFGNTCGNSIPLLLADKLADSGSDQIRILSGGYGEGFSWGFSDFYLNPENIFKPLRTDAYFTEGFVTREMPT